MEHRIKVIFQAFKFTTKLHQGRQLLDIVLKIIMLLFVRLRIPGESEKYFNFGQLYFIIVVLDCS